MEESLPWSREWISKQQALEIWPMKPKKMTPTEWMNLKNRKIYEALKAGFSDRDLDKSDIEFNYIVRDCHQQYHKLLNKIIELEDYYIENYPPPEKF